MKARRWSAVHVARDVPLGSTYSCRSFGHHLRSRASSHDDVRITTAVRKVLRSLVGRGPDAGLRTINQAQVVAVCQVRQLSQRLGVEPLDL